MTAKRFGASPDQWERFCGELSGIFPTEDALPFICNPNATPSPLSRVAAPGKVPSLYNKHHELVGFKHWTRHHSSPSDLQRWSKQPDYGIYIQTRSVRSLDIDVTDRAKSHEILDVLKLHLGDHFPRRTRPNSNKFLVPLRIDGSLSYRKRIIITSLAKPRQPIEFLADGNGFAAVGTHPSGVRYKWQALHRDIPTITPEQFEELWNDLKETFETVSMPERAAGMVRASAHALAIERDPVLTTLRERGLIHAIHEDGRVDIQCPFDDEHSGETSKSATCYFMPNTRHYKRGHFNCKHASCAGRSDADYLNALSMTDRGADYDGLHPDIRAELMNPNDDVLYLPNDLLPAPIAARRIFLTTGGEFELFRRGRAIVEIRKGHHGSERLEIVAATAFRSRLNRQGRRTREFKKLRDKDAIALCPKQCTDDTARMLLECTEIDLLPEIVLIANSPILVSHEEKLVTCRSGYNEIGRVYVRQKTEANADVSLRDARRSLAALLSDFDFQTPGDRSRALASLIAPALRMGALLPTNALATAVEADRSRTGKGFLLRVIQTIYDEQPYLVTKRNGGVGSLDESLSQGLLSGAAFIQLDNLRGRLDSQHLEGVLTAGPTPVAVRVPHRGELLIDASRVMFQLTSNGLEGTLDLGNRLLVIRLRKRPPEFTFETFSEGNLLQHIAANRGHYLGCVHAVVRYWYENGRPRLPSRHSFSDWVGTLDWIVQKIFKEVPLLQGHDAATERITRPELSWLRMIGLTILGTEDERESLRALKLFQLSVDRDIEIPQMREQMDDQQGARLIGRLMSRSFGGLTELTLDGVRITRKDERWRDPSNLQYRDSHAYIFAPDPGK